MFSSAHQFNNIFLDLKKCCAYQSDTCKGPQQIWLVFFLNPSAAAKISKLLQKRVLVTKLCNVHWDDSVSVSCVCVCVPSQKPLFPVDWRLLVEEHVANIGISQDVFGFLPFQWYFAFQFFWGFLGFANQPTMHNWRVSRGRVCGCDTGHNNPWHCFIPPPPFCAIWYWCYYPHMLRDLVSPVCREKQNEIMIFILLEAGWVETSILDGNNS